MSIMDIRLLEAMTKLHEAARIVEQDVGECDVSKSIRQAADDLNKIVQPLIKIFS